MCGACRHEDSTANAKFRFAESPADERSRISRATVHANCEIFATHPCLACSNPACIASALVYPREARFGSVRSELSHARSRLTLGESLHRGLA